VCFALSLCHPALSPAAPLCYLHLEFFPRYFALFSRSSMPSNELASTTPNTHQDPAEEGSINNENVNISVNKMPINLSHPTAMQRIGWLTTIILIASTLTMLAAIGMLCFLWWADPLNMAWRSILIKGWLPPSITLSSAVMRWSIGSQATFPTSMLAASILERKGTTIYHTAALSIIRYVNRGPFGLLQLFFQGMIKARKFRALLTVFLLTCTSLFSQFTSTILLQDLHEGVFIGLETNFSIPNGYAKSVPDWSPTPNYQKAIPRSYPMFAEYPGAPQRTDGIDDTGNSLRWLLPIPSESSRSLLHSFLGNDTAMDTRVACSRPKLVEGSLTLQGAFNPEDDAEELFLTGEVFPAASIPGLLRNSSAVEFNCSYISYDAETHHQTPLDSFNMLPGRRFRWHGL
jgi:hypothetical protein